MSFGVTLTRSLKLADMQVCEYRDETESRFPFFPSAVHKTRKGTLYLKHPGVAMIARTHTHLEPARDFLDHYFADGPRFFENYLDDEPIEDAAALSKFAGQNCYASFSNRRTKNADAAKYMDNIKSQEHGSVLEAPSYSFLFYGVDRTLTHELVRHRHFSFSMASQRYINGNMLRFVERRSRQVELLGENASPALKNAVERLHRNWIRDIDYAVNRYYRDSEGFGYARELGHPMLVGVSSTDVRKQLNQEARDGLPGCTEAPIVVTGNARAWRGFLDKRAVKRADVPIRELAVMVLKCLQHVSPLLFDDYEIKHEEDGTETAQTQWRNI